MKLADEDRKLRECLPAPVVAIEQVHAVDLGGQFVEWLWFGRSHVEPLREDRAKIAEPVQPAVQLDGFAIWSASQVVDVDSERACGG